VIGFSGRSLERDVDGVVERGGAVGRGAPDRRFERLGVVGEVLENIDPAAELDHFRDIVRFEPSGETDGRLLCRPHPPFHAVAGVEEDGEGDRLLLAGEERDRLLRTVLEHFEVRLLEVGDERALGVRDRDVQRHQLDARSELRLLLGRQRGTEDRDAGEGRDEAHRATAAAGASSHAP
jgi:hypothetical protein